jgi:hypothetical protein
MMEELKLFDVLCLLLFNALFIHRMPCCTDWPRACHVALYLSSPKDTDQLTSSSWSLVSGAVLSAAHRLWGNPARVHERRSARRVDCPAFICAAEEASKIRSIPGFMGHLSFPSRRRSHADVLSAQRDARGEHWLLIGRLMMSIEDTSRGAHSCPASSHRI